MQATSFKELKDAKVMWSKGHFTPSYPAKECQTAKLPLGRITPRGRPGKYYELTKEGKNILLILMSPGMILLNQ